jgi:pilus assembly protein CpaC
VRVTAPTEIDNRRKREYGELEEKINELFPNSSIELVIVADKLLVRGQARDSEEATDIIALVRRQANNSNFGVNSVGISQGPAADPLPGTAPLPTTNVISMLKVPGEQQVMLKVRVAEISRTAMRELGLDFSVTKKSFSFASTLGNAGNLVALLDNKDVSLMLSALSSNSYSKVLAEPNLVTLSGRPASFIAGGQFAVPTAVGVSGVQAATTFFQGFGTQVRFIPTVIDKDRIRLRVAPTFSTLNTANSVNGIPGLNTRSVYTTVDMREGQWLAIAGLIQDQQQGSKVRVPFLGDIPIGSAVFGKNSVQRDETELLILVSPQLVHPLEPDAAPQVLPGMEVTEPNNKDFFLGGNIEGRQNCDHRSTVWPAEQAAVRRAVSQSKRESRYRPTQQYYVPTPHGFSE